MVYHHILLGLLWVLYGLLHSLFASLPVKAFFKRELGPYYKHYRLGYTLFAFLGLAAIVGYGLCFSSVLIFAPTVFSKICGCIVTSAGLLIMFICIKKYFMGLSGLQSLVQEEVYQELLIAGIHKHVRHPLYLGTFLFIWGLAIFYPSASLLISDGVITLYTLIGIRLEEKKLVTDFGDQYKQYQKKVPKLIPKWS